MLTPQQLTALRAACFADPTAFAFFSGQGNAAGLRAYLNTASGSNAWRTDAQVSDITDAINWSLYTPATAIGTGDTDPVLSRKVGWLLASQTKQMNLQLMLQGRDRLNCALPNVRGGLRDAVIQVPDGAGGSTSPGGANAANVLSRCVRAGTRAEIMLAAQSQASDTTGATTARVLTFEGDVQEVEAATLIYRDDGTIWGA